MQSSCYLPKTLLISSEEIEEMKKSIEHINQLSKEIDKLYEDIHNPTELTVSIDSEL